MKKYVAFVMPLLLASMRAAAQLANPTINILTPSATIAPNANTTIYADVSNFGVTDIPANSIEVTVSVPSDVSSITTVANTGIFTISYTATGTVKLVNTGGVFVGDGQIQHIAITLHATSVTGPLNITGHIGYLGNSTNAAAGNTDIGDDNSITSVQVAGTPLPISLQAFTVSMDEACTAQLSWKTASEQGLAKFIAQYSADGRTFSSIGEVASKHSATGAQYRLSWSGASPGTGYYRLQLTEIDGSYSYSQMIGVRSDCGGNSGITVAPNPARDAITVAGLQGANTISLLDATGKVVLHNESDDATVHLNVAYLPAGMYLVHIAGAGSTVHSVRISVIR